MYKVFPCSADKIPLISGWQEAATDDRDQISKWQQTFGNRLTYWGLPCGETNGLLVLDVDVKNGVNGFESIKELPVPPTTSQTTRSGGKHFLFKYPRDGAVHGNRAGIKPGLDVRGQGGYIIHYNLDNTPLSDPPPWLTNLATTRPKTHLEVAGPSLKVAPEIAQRMILEALEAIKNAPQGESNNVLNVEAFKVGQLVSSGSIPRQLAEEILFRAAKERGKPDYEARATITSALDGSLRKPLVSPFSESPPTSIITVPPPPAPPARWTPKGLTLEALLDRSKLRKPQLFEHWSTEDIAITTADGGTGKTTLKLNEAVCLALGTRFLGFDCKQAGKTLYITGEDTEEKLTAMLGAIMQQMGMFEVGVGNEGKVQTVLQSIKIKKDADLCLIIKDRVTGFLHPNPDAMRKLMEAVDDFKPKLIVFDPIASFWGSESALNDMNKAVTKFMSDLTERSGACVEMINHMGKQSSASKDMSQFAGRGGSGLPSNARVSKVIHAVTSDEYREKTGTDLEDGKSAMTCNVNKFSDGSPLLNKPFLIVRHGYLFSRKELTPAKVKEAQNEMSDIERVFTFIKDERLNGKYPTKNVILGTFDMSTDPISKKRIEYAISKLIYTGHMGEKIMMIENPNVMVKEKAFVITDLDGKEL